MVVGVYDNKRRRGGRIRPRLGKYFFTNGSPRPSRSAFQCSPHPPPPHLMKDIHSLFNSLFKKYVSCKITPRWWLAKCRNEMEPRRLLTTRPSVLTQHEARHHSHRNFSPRLISYNRLRSWLPGPVGITFIKSPQTSWWNKFSPCSRHFQQIFRG